MKKDDSNKYYNPISEKLKIKKNKEGEYFSEIYDYENIKTFFKKNWIHSNEREFYDDLQIVKILLTNDSFVKEVFEKKELTLEKIISIFEKIKNKKGIIDGSYIYGLDESGKLILKMCGRNFIYNYNQDLYHNYDDAEKYKFLEEFFSKLIIEEYVKRIYKDYHFVDQNIHPYLNCGKNLICAGELEIIENKITYISDKSGHYQPMILNLYHCIDLINIIYPELFGEKFEIEYFRKEVDGESGSILCNLEDFKKNEHYLKSISNFKKKYLEFIQIKSEYFEQNKPFYQKFDEEWQNKILCAKEEAAKFILKKEEIEKKFLLKDKNCKKYISSYYLFKFSEKKNENNLNSFFEKFEEIEKIKKISLKNTDSFIEIFRLSSKIRENIIPIYLEVIKYCLENYGYKLNILKSIVNCLGLEIFCKILKKYSFSENIDELIKSGNDIISEILYEENKNEKLFLDILFYLWIEKCKFYPYLNVYSYEEFLKDINKDFTTEEKNKIEQLNKKLDNPKNQIEEWYKKNKNSENIEILENYKPISFDIF